MDKRFIAALVAVVLILGGIFIFSSSKTNSSTSGTNQPTNHIEGQGKDNITLIEYGDYQCPFCGEFYPVVKQVQQEYNSQIFFQFRNLPLTQIHANAFAGARAAEAAGLMGQFWQMHDLLYDQNANYYASNQKLANWIGASDPETFFVQYAGQLGLNVDQFKQNYASTKVNDLINADLAAFNKTGQQEATPSFFLDSKPIQPQATVASFEKLINDEITKKGFTPPPASASSTPATTTPSGQTQSVQ